MTFWTLERIYLLISIFVVTGAMLIGMGLYAWYLHIRKRRRRMARNKAKIIGGLRELRQDRGYELRYVAKRIEVSMAALSRWEHKQAKPRPRNIERLAQFYHVTAADILRMVK
jgi:DNA-binding transcriptional regulator YiaG